MESSGCLTLLERVPRDQRESQWCFLTSQVSELLQEGERPDKLEQKHADRSPDEQAHQEQMATVVVLEEQIQNLRDDQELLW